MHVWNVLHAAGWNTGRKNDIEISAHHRTTFSATSQLRHASTIGKMLNSNISSRCPQNMVNFGQLTAEVGSGVWRTPANLNGFRVLASLLHRRRSTMVNQTLHDVWLSHGLVHYIYIFGSSCPLTEFCHVQNSPCVRVLRSAILTALLHGTRAVSVSQTLPHSAGAPSINFNQFISQLCKKRIIEDNKSI